MKSGYDSPEFVSTQRHSDMQPFPGFGRHVVIRSHNKARRTLILRAVYMLPPSLLVTSHGGSLDQSKCAHIDQAI